MNAVGPPSCYRCHSREWNDAVHVNETIVLFLMADGQTRREGRKYNEERDNLWQCANGHNARPQTARVLERLLAQAEENQ